MMNENDIYKQKVTFEQVARFNKLLANKILVCVSPIDTWDEWVWSILCEDAMAPFCCIDKSNVEHPYPTFSSALEAGLKVAEQINKQQ